MKYDPVNTSRRWTKADLKILEIMTNDRKSNAEISLVLNRTPAAVAFKKSSGGFKPSSKIKSRKKRIPVPLEIPKISSVTTRDQAKEMSRAARQIARANGKRITMAMFFVEDL